MAEQESCLAYLEALLRRELQTTPQSTSIERLSIALGAVETALTSRDASKRAWPADLAATVEQLAAAFDGFVASLSPALAAAPTVAAKVKAVADAVWSKLQKGYSKDLPHAQHVFCFAAALLPGGLPGVKRQLDCAGVVTTTYALCQALAQRHPQHAELACVAMQVSEDHCWLQTGTPPTRETSVEVTTDTAAKRGLPVAADAWRGWLYTGGAAVHCTPHRALAAAVTSINPALSSGRKGEDSEELQAVQKRLLEVLLAEAPQALYPAALCALADLLEVYLQDEVDAARDRGDAAALARLLQRRPGDSLDLFQRAIALASGGGGGVGGGSGDGTSAAEAEAAPAAGAAAPLPPGGGQWYVHSYLAAFLARRAEFLASCAAALPAAPAGEQPEEEEAAQPAAGQPTAAEGAQPAEQQPAQQQQPGQQQPGEQQPAGQPASQQQQPYMQQALATYRAALAAAGAGGAVLAGYRFQPTDEQLFKDIEGLLEEAVRDGLATLAKQQAGSGSSGGGGPAPLTDPSLLQPVLTLWDGICWLFSGRAKPGAWVAMLLKVLKLFSPEARAAAATAAAAAGQASSGPMQRAAPLWRDLKPLETLRQLFESADVDGAGEAGSGAAENGGGRGAKRARRGA